MVRSRFGEVCSCCCLPALPGPAWVLLNYVMRTILCTSVNQIVIHDHEYPHCIVFPFTTLLSLAIAEQQYY